MIFEEWNNRFPNFSPPEVLSPIALKRYETHGIIGIDLNALKILQEFRNKIQVPLKINHNGLNLRGYRTPKEHLSISQGASMSPHCRGLAFDITPEKMKIHTLASRAFDFNFFKGIGVYDTFIHVDIWDRFGTGRIVKWRS